MESLSPLQELFPQNREVAQTKNSVDELDQSDFLELMVAQLENQDPTKPMDNLEFLSQISQFGTVSGIQDLQQTVTDLSSTLVSNQALQAASLVGRSVVTNTNLGSLTEGGSLNATVELPQSTPAVTVYVQDVSGRLVHSESLGAAPAGPLAWQWNGTDVSGNTLPPGQYRVSAEVQSGGANRAVSVFAHHQVDSVSIGNGSAAVLNLDDGSEIGLTEVKSIL